MGNYKPSNEKPVLIEAKGSVRCKCGKVLFGVDLVGFLQCPNCNEEFVITVSFVKV